MSTSRVIRSRAAFILNDPLSSPTSPTTRYIELTLYYQDHHNEANPNIIKDFLKRCGHYLAKGICSGRLKPNKSYDESEYYIVENDIHFNKTEENLNPGFFEIDFITDAQIAVEINDANTLGSGLLYRVGLDNDGQKYEEETKKHYSEVEYEVLADNKRIQEIDAQFKLYYFNNLEKKLNHIKEEILVLIKKTIEAYVDHENNALKKLKEINEEKFLHHQMNLSDFLQDRLNQCNLYLNNTELKIELIKSNAADYSLEDLENLLNSVCSSLNQHISNIAETPTEVPLLINALKNEKFNGLFIDSESNSSQVNPDYHFTKAMKDHEEELCKRAKEIVEEVEKEKQRKARSGWSEHHSSYHSIPTFDFNESTAEQKKEEEEAPKKKKISQHEETFPALIFSAEAPNHENILNLAPKKNKLYVRSDNGLYFINKENLVTIKSVDRAEDILHNSIPGTSYVRYRNQLYYFTEEMQEDAVYLIFFPFHSDPEKDKLSQEKDRQLQLERLKDRCHAISKSRYPVLVKHDDDHFSLYVYKKNQWQLIEIPPDVAKNSPEEIALQAHFKSYPIGENEIIRVSSEHASPELWEDLTAVIAKKHTDIIPQVSTNKSLLDNFNALNPTKKIKVLSIKELKQLKQLLKNHGPAQQHKSAYCKLSITDLALKVFDALLKPSETDSPLTAENHAILIMLTRHDDNSTASISNKRDEKIAAKITSAAIQCKKELADLLEKFEANLIKKVTSTHADIQMLQEIVFVLVSSHKQSINQSMEQFAESLIASEKRKTKNLGLLIEKIMNQAKTILIDELNLLTTRLLNNEKTSETLIKLVNLQILFNQIRSTGYLEDVPGQTFHSFKLSQLDTIEHSTLDEGIAVKQRLLKYIEINKKISEKYAQINEENFLPQPIKNNLSKEDITEETITSLTDRLSKLDLVIEYIKLKKKNDVITATIKQDEDHGFTDLTTRQSPSIDDLLKNVSATSNEQLKVEIKNNKKKLLIHRLKKIIENKNIVELKKYEFDIYHNDGYITKLINQVKNLTPKDFDVEDEDCFVMSTGIIDGINSLSIPGNAAYIFHGDTVYYKNKAHSSEAKPIYIDEDKKLREKLNPDTTRKLTAEDHQFVSNITQHKHKTNIRQYKDTLIKLIALTKSSSVHHKETHFEVFKKQIRLINLLNSLKNSLLKANEESNEYVNSIEGHFRNPENRSTSNTTYRPESRGTLYDEDAHFDSELQTLISEITQDKDETQKGSENLAKKIDLLIEKVSSAYYDELTQTINDEEKNKLLDYVNDTENTPLTYEKLIQIVERIAITYNEVAPKINEKIIQLNNNFTDIKKDVEHYRNGIRNWITNKKSHTEDKIQSIQANILLLKLPLLHVNSTLSLSDEEKKLLSSYESTREIDLASASEKLNTQKENFEKTNNLYEKSREEFIALQKNKSELRLKKDKILLSRKEHINCSPNSLPDKASPRMGSIAKKPLAITHPKVSPTNRHISVTLNKPTIFLSSSHAIDNHNSDEIEIITNTPENTELLLLEKQNNQLNEEIFNTAAIAKKQKINCEKILKALKEADRAHSEIQSDIIAVNKKRKNLVDNLNQDVEKLKQQIREAEKEFNKDEYKLHHAITAESRETELREAFLAHSELMITIDVIANQWQEIKNQLDAKLANKTIPLSIEDIQEQSANLNKLIKNLTSKIEILNGIEPNTLNFNSCKMAITNAQNKIETRDRARHDLAELITLATDFYEKVVDAEYNNPEKLTQANSSGSAYTQKLISANKEKYQQQIAEQKANLFTLIEKCKADQNDLLRCAQGGKMLSAAEITVIYEHNQKAYHAITLEFHQNFNAYNNQINTDNERIKKEEELRKSVNATLGNIAPLLPFEHENPCKSAGYFSKEFAEIGNYDWAVVTQYHYEQCKQTHDDIAETSNNLQKQLEIIRQEVNSSCTNEDIDFISLSLEKKATDLHKKYLIELANAAKAQTNNDSYSYFSGKETVELVINDEKNNLWHHHQNTVNYVNYLLATIQDEKLKEILSAFVNNSSECVVPELVRDQLLQLKNDIQPFLAQDKNILSILSCLLEPNATNREILYNDKISNAITNLLELLDKIKELKQKAEKPELLNVIAGGTCFTQVQAQNAKNDYQKQLNLSQERIDKLLQCCQSYLNDTILLTLRSDQISTHLANIDEQKKGFHEAYKSIEETFNNEFQNHKIAIDNFNQKIEDENKFKIEAKQRLNGITQSFVNFLDENESRFFSKSVSEIPEWATVTRKHYGECKITLVSLAARRCAQDLSTTKTIQSIDDYFNLSIAAELTHEKIQAINTEIEIAENAKTDLQQDKAIYEQSQSRLYFNDCKDIDDTKEKEKQELKKLYQSLIDHLRDHLSIFSRQRREKLKKFTLQNTSELTPDEMHDNMSKMLGESNSVVPHHIGNAEETALGNLDKEDKEDKELHGFETYANPNNREFYYDNPSKLYKSPNSDRKYKKTYSGYVSGTIKVVFGTILLALGILNPFILIGGAALLIWGVADIGLNAKENQRRSMHSTERNSDRLSSERDSSCRYTDSSGSDNDARLTYITVPDELKRYSISENLSRSSSRKSSPRGSLENDQLENNHLNDLDNDLKRVFGDPVRPPISSAGSGSMFDRKEKPKEKPKVAPDILPNPPKLVLKIKN